MQNTVPVFGRMGVLFLGFYFLIWSSDQCGLWLSKRCPQGDIGQDTETVYVLGARGGKARRDDLCDPQEM